MNSLIPISRNIFLHILFLLVIGPFSKAQELDYSRPEEPILWANSIHLAYGLVPSSLDLLLEVYSLEGIIPSEQRRKIPALLEEYYIQQKSDSTLVFGQFIWSTFKNSEVVNPELFTLTANSPILISGRAGQITYGINDSVFLALYEFLESQEIALEEWDEKFGELLLKYQQLERDLELRRDNLAKEALRILKRGEIGKALELLRERYEFSIREVDRARKEQALAAYDYGNILELRLKYRDATDVFKDAVEQHPENTQFLNAFASNLNSIGKYDQAIPWLQKAIHLDSLAYGGQDTSVSMLYGNMGRVWEFKGEFGKAIWYFEQALDIYLMAFGGKHSKVASQYSNLGVSWRSKGEYERALKYLERALEIDSLIFGKDHLALERDYLHLGRIWDSKGNYDRAIGYYERALRIDTILLSKEHPKVSDVYNNLGLAWESKGEYDRAIEYFEKALRITSSVFGETHPDNAHRLTNLGSSWRLKGNYDKALEYHEQALKIDTAALGHRHTNVAIRYNNLGSVWEIKGDYDRAIKYYEQALEIDTIALGIDHPRVANRYNNLGSAWSYKGEYDKAISFYEQALGIDTLSLSKDHPRLANRFNNLGSAWAYKGDYDQAISYFGKALRIDTISLGRNYPEVAIRYSNLGSMWSYKGDYDRAIEYFEKALRILSTLGENPPNLAPVLSSMAGALYSKGDYDHSIEYYQKALKIFFLYLPEHHPNIKTTHQNYAGPLNAKGMEFYQDRDYEQALPYFRSSLKYSQLGEDRSFMVTGYNNVGTSHKHLGDYDSALVYLNQGIALAKQLDQVIEKQLQEYPDSILALPDFEAYKQQYLHTTVLKRLYFHKASTFFRMGKIKKAEEIFERLKKQAKEEKDQEFLAEIVAEEEK